MTPHMEAGSAVAVEGNNDKGDDGSEHNKNDDIKEHMRRAREAYTDGAWGHDREHLLS